MEKEHTSELFQRYLVSLETGKEPYFDVDEINLLLDDFEQLEDYTHYEGVLKLGLKLYPFSIDLKIKECRLHFYYENYNQTLCLLDTIAETNNQELDMMRMECYCSLNQYPDVLDYIKKLVLRKCEYLEAIFEHTASTLEELEMIDEVCDFVERALLLFPENLVLKDILCCVLELNGDFTKAISVCNELIDKDPYSSNYWGMLGRLYTMTSNFDKAIEAFDFAITCDSTAVELKLLKAYCLYINENYKKAIEVYSDITVDDDESSNSLKSIIADCYLKLDDYKQAYRLLKEIIERKREAADTYTYLNFIRCCMEIERDSEAYEALQRAGELFPDNVRVLTLLAIAHMGRGREDLAMGLMNKIVDNILADDKKGKTKENDQFIKQIISFVNASNHHSIQQSLKEKPVKFIPNKDLVKKYLNNKDNNN
jgi:tetratricopeptide (TPR) repeat protein